MRKGLGRRRNPFLSFGYLTVGLAILFYALPRLPGFAEGMVSGIYVFLWLVFAFLVVAANLYYLIGADSERKRSDVKDLTAFLPGEAQRPPDARMVRRRQH